MDTSFFDDETVSDISTLLFYFEEDPIFGFEFLDISKLDYSIDSLKHVDDYLDTIRKLSDIEKAWDKVILRTGSYLGEVIRRKGVVSIWHWLSYKNACKLSKSLKEYSYDIETSYILWRGSESFCFPMAKVAKFISKGRGESVRSFAKIIIDLWKQEDNNK